MEVEKEGERENGINGAWPPWEGSSNGSRAQLSTLENQWVAGMSSKLTGSSIQLASLDIGIIDVDHRSAPSPYAVQVKTHGTCQYRKKKKENVTSNYTFSPSCRTRSYFRAERNATNFEITTIEIRNSLLLDRRFRLAWLSKLSMNLFRRKKVILNFSGKINVTWLVIDYLRRDFRNISDDIFIRMSYSQEYNCTNNNGKSSII